ncbi:MAG TPA: CoA-binding protein [archaeon]|nr:CoA-binding protein [archaeon]
MNNFFNPGSVVIIGASHTKGKIGYEIANNFINGEYKGKVFFVNTNAEEILGKKCYSSLKDIDEKIDLAVISTPAKTVPGIISECIEKDVKAVIIISAGFSETGEDGKILSEKIKKLSKNRIRIIGPNCLGIFDPISGVDTIFLPREKQGRPNTGSIAFITQSGAVGASVLDWLSEENIGISRFISYGNALDIGESDLIEYLDGDDRTAVIAMYMEGVKDGRKFFEAAKKCKKPIITLKAGKTAEGSKAASSHTAVLAGETKIYSGVFRQSGIIEAQTWEELFDVAKAFAMQPRTSGRKLAIITDGGGFGVLAADEAGRNNLLLPEPTDEIKQSLELPAYACLHNPIDLTGDATAERYEKVINACLSGCYDGVVVCLLFQVPTLDERIVDVIADAKKYGKTILCCAVGGLYTKQMSKKLEEKGVPVFETPERAVKVFADMARWTPDSFGE